MDRQQLVELRLGGLGKAGMGADASVIDQKIEALLCENILEQSADVANKIIEGRALAHIQLQHRGTAAQRLDLLGHRLGFGRSTVVGADDVDALCCQVQRGAFAQATAGAGDQCDFTGHGAILSGGQWD